MGEFDEFLRSGDPALFLPVRYLQRLQLCLR